MKPSKPAPLSGRQTRDLNGEWSFRTDPANRGESAGWTGRQPDSVRLVEVPSVWRLSGEPNYQGAAWYWRTFQLPAAWSKTANQHIRLFFTQLCGNATLWVNGKKAGGTADSPLPAVFDVTPHLRRDVPNLLAVRIASVARTGADRAAGICGDVVLAASDEAYLTSVWVEAAATGWATAHVEVMNASEKSADGEFVFEVYRSAPRRRIAEVRQTVAISPGANRATLSMRVSRTGQWSPDKPSLYQARIAFQQGQDVLDNVETSIGFRTVSVALPASAVKLNGELAALTPGTVEYESWRDPHRAPERAEEVVRAARARGVTLLMPGALPLDPYILAAADRLGMLAIQRADIAGSEPGLLARDGSHPCVIAWYAGVGTDKPSLARLDPSRPALTGALGGSLLAWTSESTEPVRFRNP